MAKTLKYAIRISEDERDELEKKANELGVARATVIRLLMKKYLKKL